MVKAPAEETSLPGRLRKLREKKSVKRIVVEKQKSDNMLSTRGHMFKVQAQFSGKESTIKSQRLCGKISYDFLSG